MSTHAVKRSSGDSPDAGDASKPRQASRSVSLLTPEQLQRKRAQDRESQRQTRARVKHTIAELEKRVEMLNQELHLTRLENASLQERNQLAPPGTIPTIAPPQPIPGPEDFPEGTAAIMDVVVRQKGRPAQYMGMGSQFANSLVVSGPIRTEPAGQNILDPSLFYLYNNFEQQPMPIQVWDARPAHYPATCRLDKSLLDIIQTLNPIHAIGGNDFEFAHPKYPHVSALMNPQHHSASYPVTAAIVTDVIHVLTVESLPEQIGILYVMCCMIRWVITGSKEDYYAMPEWLRPGAAQIVTSHPIWVDMMPWPKSRDRLCRDAQYHDKYETFKDKANQTISVNWPYEPSDTLIRISANEFAINPVFITHIRTLSNWTYGAEFLQEYPEFEGDVNIGKARVIHR